MLLKLKWKPSSLTSLVVAQALGALNDNTFRLLITFKIIALLGVQNSQSITSIVGIIFVLPFLLFCVPAGWLADRYSKRTVLIITKLLEILVALGGLAIMVKGSAIMAYGMLGLMSLQSTFFGPSKYGIIPEIVPKHKVAQANGWLNLTTFIGIILGTFLGSLLTEITHKNFFLTGAFCLSVAIVGSYFIFGIEKTIPQNPKKSFPKTGFIEPFLTLKIIKDYRYLRLSIFATTLFFFIGSFTQINILPYAVKHLHLKAYAGGYLFLLTALGIGIGSLISGKISKDIIELGILPLSLFFMGIAFLVLAINFNLTCVVITVFLLGVLGGLYTVPAESFIQVRSPKNILGQVLACNNFFNFFGILLSSALLYSLPKFFHFSPANNFLFLGICVLLISLPFLKTLSHFVKRLLLLAISCFVPKDLKFKDQIRNEPFIIHLEGLTITERAQVLKALRKYDIYFFSQAKHAEKKSKDLIERKKCLCISSGKLLWEGYTHFIAESNNKIIEIKKPF